MSESTASFHAYVALLKVLHKNKVIDINDVVSEMGNTIDFAKIHHMDKDHDLTFELFYYEKLLEIASALPPNE
jgi:hypothetical protein